MLTEHDGHAPTAPEEHGERASRIDVSVNDVWSATLSLQAGHHRAHRLKPSERRAPARPATWREPKNPYRPVNHVGRCSTAGRSKNRDIVVTSHGERLVPSEDPSDRVFW
jgi:hypothetical protein